jgi:hypothetical protein
MLRVVRGLALLPWGGSDDAPDPAELIEPLTEAGVTDGLERHGLGGLLFAALSMPSRAAALATLPAEVRGSLKAQYRSQWLQVQSIQSQLKSVAARLGSGGIPFVVLKGPPFAERFYGDPNVRATRDLDLLVRPQDLERLDSVLIDEGYRCLSSRGLGRSWSLRCAHHFVYASQTGIVEAHWQLAAQPSFTIDSERLWSGVREMSSGGTQVPVLSAEYALVEQLLTVFKDVGLGTIRLRSFLDVVRAVDSQQNSDWAGFFDRRAQEGLLTLAVNALLLTLGILGLEGRYSGLDEALQGYGGLRRGGESPWEQLEIFEAESPALRNRWRVASWLEAPRWRSAAWECLSLPWRLAIYRTGLPE